MEHKRDGICFRVSNEDPVKGASLEVHERRARSCAQTKGWEVMKVYRLEAVRGKASCLRSLNSMKPKSSTQEALKLAMNRWGHR